MDLIIDTSSEELKVVLVNNKNYVINRETGVKHLEHLLPEIDRLLRENNKELKDITNFSVVVGPGSFTGIRIGVSTIKAFASVFQNSKIVAINMLDMLSYVIKNSNSNIKDDFFVIIKSTATKFYLGHFNSLGETIEQKLCEKNKIKNLFETTNLIFSYNFEENFDEYKTKKIILMPGNYVSFVDYLKGKKRFTKLKDLKPIYLALSQAEEELLKKEKNEPRNN